MFDHSRIGKFSRWILGKYLNQVFKKTKREENIENIHILGWLVDLTISQFHYFRFTFFSNLVVDDERESNVKFKNSSNKFNKFQGKDNNWLQILFTYVNSIEDSMYNNKV